MSFSEEMKSISDAVNDSNLKLFNLVLDDIRSIAQGGYTSRYFCYFEIMGLCQKAGIQGIENTSVFVKYATFINEYLRSQGFKVLFGEDLSMRVLWETEK